MALISARNFILPFTSKLHLGTIVFVVLLFAAFRAAGGNFTVSPDRGSSREISSEYDDSEPSDEELLGAIGNRRSAEASRAAPARKSTAARDSDSAGNAAELEEIERRLGLR